MNKKITTLIVVAILLIIIGFSYLKTQSNSSNYITTKVERGDFEVLVFSSGQLEAQNSEDILMPEELKDRMLRIYEIKITDIVEEGTVVDSGSYVATLDQKAVEEILNNANEELEQKVNELQDAKMDSNLNLSNYRDLIINAKEDVEEQMIILRESKFESPAIIRKAEMNVDKAKRNLKKIEKGYKLKKQKEASQVNRKKIELKQMRNRVDKLDKAYQSLIVLAPKKGMVIYKKTFNGQKIKVGSKISQWDPVIARLPDLSSMLSITYINEIDISNVKKGQKVEIGVDAIPNKHLQGEVVKVANIGQMVAKSDAKVFEVKIRVFGDVKDVKPAMTTSNIIHAAQYIDTLFIPADAVFENDSMQYVYVKRGKLEKQVVELGDDNENYVLIANGLKEGEELLLNEPENHDKMEFAGMEIYEAIKKRKMLAEQEEKKKIEEQKKKKFIDSNKSRNSGGGFIIIE